MLPAGALPHNPSELLGSKRVDDLLSELASPGTMLILDVPANPVADAQVLLNNPLIDAAVLVARVERTTREEMRLARSFLDHHMVEPVGLVVTDVRDSGRYGYGYGSYGAASTTVAVEIDAPADRSGRILDDSREGRVVKLGSETTGNNGRNGAGGRPGAGARHRGGSSRRRTSK